MAKMALNGYEIGIQRKIKPADHIQSMADKIQDTVVTKHPTNTDNLTSSDNNMIKTLDRGYKTHENIQSIGDKIKDTIKNNHPTIESMSKSNILIPPPLPNNQPTMETMSKPNILVPPPIPNNQLTVESMSKPNILAPPPLPNNHGTMESMSKPNILIPPPLPNSPIPTFNVHSTPIGHSLNINGDKDKNKYDTVPKTLKASLIMDERSIHNNDKFYSGSGNSSNEDLYKDKTENNFMGTLRKTGIDKSSFLNSMNDSTDTNTNHDVKSELKYDNTYSNTLNKRKLFEKPETGAYHSINNQTKSNDKVNNVCETNTWNKTNTFEHAYKAETGKNTQATHQEDELIKKKELPDQLYNNSLYTLKTSNNKANTNGNEQNNSYGDIAFTEEIKNLSDSDEKQQQQKPKEEVVVRRRQKKNSRDDDGRRDSHIIARPLSTIQCADVAEGLYPVCHICDKAITR